MLALAFCNGACQPRSITGLIRTAAIQPRRSELPLSALCEGDSDKCARPSPVIHSGRSILNGPMGVDVWDFRPVSLSEIEERANGLPVNPLCDVLEPG